MLSSYINNIRLQSLFSRRYFSFSHASCALILLCGTVKWWVSEMESDDMTTHPLSLSLACIFFPSHLLFSVNFPPSASHPRPNHNGHHFSPPFMFSIPFPTYLHPSALSVLRLLPSLHPDIFNSFIRPPPFHLHPFFLGAAGGLLSERYLGKVEPMSRAELYTASLSKYKNMIDTWGGWSLFQDLLATLETVAKRHDSSIASVATRYVLDRPAVGGVIVGCRLGVAGAGQHISDSLRSCSSDLKLTAEDLSAIEAVTQRSRDLMAIIGDCGDEYRN